MRHVVVVVLVTGVRGLKDFEGSSSLVGCLISLVLLGDGMGPKAIQGV
jgi:hypothetical protein